MCNTFSFKVITCWHFSLWYHTSWLISSHIDSSEYMESKRQTLLTPEGNCEERFQSEKLPFNALRRKLTMRCLRCSRGEPEPLKVRTLSEWVSDLATQDCGLTPGSTMSSHATWGTICDWSCFVSAQVAAIFPFAKSTWAAYFLFSLSFHSLLMV